MKFSDISGHREQIRKLTSMVDSGRMPHALLLHGPSGVGKMRVARALLQYLYCTERKNGDSCGKCPACLQTDKLNNPDIHFIYPIVKRESKKKELSSHYSEEWKEFLEASPYNSPEEWLEAIEAGNSIPMIHVTESGELLRLGSLSAYGNGYKVFVIWQPEKMNIQAANKLLKIIEEPYEDTLFILVSNNAGQMLPTIISRLQSVEFQPLPDAEIIEYICKQGKSSEEAASLAKIAKGNMNKAVMLSKSGGEMEEFRYCFIDVMRAAYGRNMIALKDYADKYAGFGREKSQRLLDYFARMVRESFISNLKCEALEAMTLEEKKFVEKFGPFINGANVEEICKEIDRAKNDISQNANQKIVYFDLMIELTRLIRTKGVGKTK